MRSRQGKNPNAQAAVAKAASPLSAEWLVGFGNFFPFFFHGTFSRTWGTGIGHVYHPEFRVGGIINARGYL
jgi:hypothetical protein